LFVESVDVFGRCVVLLIDTADVFGNCVDLLVEAVVLVYS